MNLVGLTNIKYELNHIKNDIPHMLFFGGRGTGKTTLAQYVAEINSKKLTFLTGNTLKINELLNVFIGVEEDDIILIDECLTGDTLIVKADGGVEPIKSLKSGNLFLGGTTNDYKVLKSKPILQFITDYGIIESTHTHPHLVMTPHGCVVKRAQDIKKCDKLLSSTWIPHTTQRDWTSSQLELIALIIADGCLMGRGLGFKFSFKKEKSFNRALEIVKRAHDKFIVSPTSFRATKNRDYVLRIYGKEFCNYLCTTFNIPTKDKKYNTTINDEIFYSPLKSIESFIDTILFFEGWNDKTVKRGFKFVQMVSFNFLNRFSLLLRKFGIVSSITVVKDTKTKIGRHYRLRIKKQVSKDELAIYSRIYKINKLPSAQVYDYTTETGLFTANGFITHNCHRLSPSVEEVLYQPMETGNLYIKDMSGNFQEYKLPKFTLIGTTTKPSMISKPLMSRFQLMFQIPHYNIRELARIIKVHFKEMSNKDALQIAINIVSPREAVNLARRIVSLGDTVQTSLEFIGYKFGLSKAERFYLKIVHQVGKISLTNLASALQLDEDEVRYIEEKLIRKGYISVSSKGRSLTVKGIIKIKELKT